MDHRNLPALQLFAAGLSTTYFFKPARLVLETLLSAEATLLHQERTLGTSHLVRVALVFDLSVSACYRSCTVEPTFWRLSATRLWRQQDSFPTCAAYFFKHSIQTRRAGAFVAESLAVVVPTLKRSPADPRADMFGFYIFNRYWSLHPVFPF